MVEAIRERTEGRARTGFVNLRSFDEGVVETLGATIDEELQNYFLHLPIVETVGFDPPESSPFYRGPVDPRPGLPGIPVTFSYPEDVFEKYSIPVVLVRREGIDPAMQRWHPGALQYRTPGRGALPTGYRPTPASEVKYGFDRAEQVDQAAPFDLSYTINVVARNRGAPGIRNQANRILDHVLRIYQPYCEVRLRDSIGDARTYEAFMDGVSPLDEVADVTDRVIGFAVSLRIEGELDLTDPVVRATVTKAATLRAKEL
jgi:hypothetical protein